MCVSYWMIRMIGRRASEDLIEQQEVSSDAIDGNRHVESQVTALVESVLLDFTHVLFDFGSFELRLESLDAGHVADGVGLVFLEEGKQLLQ